MECSSKVIDTIVGQIVPLDFKQTFGCDDVVVKQVKKRVTKEIVKLIQENKSHIEIILHLKQQLQAIFHGEKLLCDAALKEPAEGKIRISYSESENESDDDEEIKPEIIKSLPSATSQVLDLNDISQYKLSPDVLENVKGIEMRGKNFPISNDGLCPRCNHKNNYFVILDFLFPSGDMPELLEYLLTHGKAVLWSSKQQAAKCKDPPTFLCNGRCPADCLRNGFNINWNKVDLEAVYLAPAKRKTKTFSKHLHADVGSRSNFSKQEPNANNDLLVVEDSGHESEEYDETKVDIGYYKGKVSWVVLDDCVDDAEQLPIDEECIIRTMLAFEEARTDFVNGDMKTLSHAEDSDDSDLIDNDGESALTSQVLTTIPSPVATVSSTTFMDIPVTSVAVENNVTLVTSINTGVSAQYTSPAEQQDTPDHPVKQAESKPKIEFTTDDFPISLDGLCPYCRSSDVVYIIMYDKHENIDHNLPALLQKLLKDKKAKKIKKGEYDVPSFQCNSCTYGFNLDWTCTNLENIFYNGNTGCQTSSFQAPAVSTSTMAVMSQPYVNYQNSSYGHFSQTSVPYNGFPYPATWLAFQPGLPAAVPLQPGITAPVPLVAGYTPPFAGLPTANVLPANLSTIQAALAGATMQAGFTAHLRPIVPNIVIQSTHPLNPMQPIPLTSVMSNAASQPEQSGNSLQITDQMAVTTPNISCNASVSKQGVGSDAATVTESVASKITIASRTENEEISMDVANAQERTANENDVVNEQMVNKDERISNEIDTLTERTTNKSEHMPKESEHMPNESENMPKESDVGNEHTPNECQRNDETLRNKPIKPAENIFAEPSLDSKEHSVKVEDVAMETADVNSTNSPVKDSDIASSNINLSETDVTDSLKSTSPLLNVVVGNQDGLPVDMELSIAAIDQNVVDGKDLELPVTSDLNLYPTVPSQKDEIDSSPFTESLVNIVTDVARRNEDKLIDIPVVIRTASHGKDGGHILSIHEESNKTPCEKKLKLEEQPSLDDGGPFETDSSETSRNKSATKTRGKRGRGRGRGRKK